METAKCKKAGCNPKLQQMPCCGMEYSVTCSVCKIESHPMTSKELALKEWENTINEH